MGTQSSREVEADPGELTGDSWPGRGLSKTLLNLAILRIQAQLRNAFSAFLDAYLDKKPAACPE
jgi:hypothetical protein